MYEKNRKFVLKKKLKKIRHNRHKIQYERIEKLINKRKGRTKVIILINY